MASLGLILNVGSFRGAVPSPMLVAILAQRRSFLRFQVPCRLNPSTLPVACAAELRDMDRRDWDAGSSDILRMGCIRAPKNGHCGKLCEKVR